MKLSSRAILSVESRSSCAGRSARDSRKVISLTVLCWVGFVVSGCGITTFGGGGQDSALVQPRQSVPPVSAMLLELASEPHVFHSSKAPQQMPVQTARALPKPEFGVTPEVQKELDRFLTKDRGTVVQVLERRSSNLAMLEKVFQGEGVPTELLAVAAVESRFDPQAKSPAGARGMWQFMSSTARLYGLKVTGRQDERLDPVRSTIAAARHLRDLFLSYNDWHLALAAYNAGTGRVNKALSRGGEADFWTLVRSGSLSGETCRFVPKVIALAMIVSEPDKYGFTNQAMIG